VPATRNHPRITKLRQLEKHYLQTGDLNVTQKLKSPEGIKKKKMVKSIYSSNLQVYKTLQPKYRKYCKKKTFDHKTQENETTILQKKSITEKENHKKSITEKENHNMYYKKTYQIQQMREKA